MFPLWFALSGGSFVFLEVGPSILLLPFWSLYSLYFACFGLFMIGRVEPLVPIKAITKKSMELRNVTNILDWFLIFRRLIEPKSRIPL
jgi:hypothetical protein